ncbi:unnamed protein product [marine sediment metagenome]|uniref:Uncharacterized protein n=1 Tax=marine sediment metagenome TaxID=412755 RepID=X0UWN9_9ZZZZ
MEARDIVERCARADGRVSRTQEGQLGGFAARLRQRRMASDNQIPFFVRWIERFLRLSRAWQDTLRVFLEDLGEARLPTGRFVRLRTR